jgi:hypothetical protein
MKLAPHAAALALILLASCSHDPMASLAAFEGDWVGTHKILGEDTEHAATYAVRREADVLVWDFTSGFQGSFTGRALQRWDKEKKVFIEAWTDSATPDSATEVSGTFDAKTGLMIMTGTAPDWVSGAQVGYEHHTTLVSPNEWKYVMKQEGPDGAFREVMWIHMKRK